MVDDIKIISKSVKKTSEVDDHFIVYLRKEWFRTNTYKLVPKVSYLDVWRRLMRVDISVNILSIFIEILVWVIFMTTEINEMKNQR